MAGLQNTPNADNSTNTRVMGKISLRGKCFNMEELEDLVDEETKVLNLKIGKLESGL